MKRIIILLLCISFNLFAQTSMNMSLLGTYNYNTEGSDIWGWADVNNNEYALVCLRNGFSVTNVTNPNSPYEEFFISDIPSTWREIGLGLYGKSNALSLRYQAYIVNGPISYNNGHKLRGSDFLRKGSHSH